MYCAVLFYSSILAIEMCKNSDLFKAICINASSVGNLAGSKIEAADIILTASSVNL